MNSWGQPGQSLPSLSIPLSSINELRPLPSASKHAVSIGSPLWRNPAGHYIPGVTTSFDDVDVTEAFGKTANERQYTRMTARSLKRVRRNVTNRVFGS